MMGKWWLVTFGTYGQWLPGDPRGFKTWRRREYIPPVEGKSDFGEPTYKPDEYHERHQAANDLTGAAVLFSPQQRQIVADAIVEDIESLPMCSSSIAVAAPHIHLIAKFGGLRIRPTVGRFRFAATQKLHECGFEGDRFWAKGCHMKSLPDEAAFLQAFEYVKSHEEEGAVIKIWQLSYGDDVLPF